MHSTHLPTSTWIVFLELSEKQWTDLFDFEIFSDWLSCAVSIQAMPTGSSNFRFLHYFQCPKRWHKKNRGYLLVYSRIFRWIDFSKYEIEWNKLSPLGISHIHLLSISVFVNNIHICYIRICICLTLSWARITTLMLAICFAFFLSISISCLYYVAWLWKNRPCDRNLRDAELISCRLRRVEPLCRLPGSALQQLAMCGFYEDLEKGITCK